MAGSRLSNFKKSGGGFLNNVDGVLQDYEFVTETGFEKGNRKGDFNPLYFRMTALVDGATEPIQTHLFAGSSDDFTIEDEGKTLNPTSDASELWQGTEFYTFLASMIEHGFPEDQLPTDEISFVAMIGYRLRFGQKVNAEKTAKLGKRKGKNGKGEFNRTDLVVMAVLAAPGKAGKGTNAKAPVKSVKAVNGKPNGRVAPAEDTDDDSSDEVDITQVAVETLMAVLQKAKKNRILKAALTVPVYDELSDRQDIQTETYKLISSEDFLKRQMGWTYDKAKQAISLDA